MLGRLDNCGIINCIGNFIFRIKKNTANKPTTIPPVLCEESSPLVAERRARSMIEVNTNTFEKLKSMVSNLREEASDFHDKICIKNNGETSEEWIKYVDISRANNEDEILILNQRISIIKLIFNDELYVAVKGLSDVTVDPEHFEFNHMQPGLFNFLASKGFITPRISNAQAEYIYDHFLFKQDNVKIKCLDFEDLLEYYDTSYLYKVRKDSLFNSVSVDRALSYFVAKDKEQLFTSPTLYNSLIDVIFTGGEDIPFSQISKVSLYISEIKHAYLELYRCLERVYSVPTMIELKGKFSELSNYNNFDVSKTIEEITGWRQSEENGLIKLIQLLDTQEMISLFNFIAVDSLISTSDSIFFKLDDYRNTPANEKAKKDTYERELRELIAKRVSTRIYKTRNGIVHFRPVFDSDSVTDDDMERLCLATIFLIRKVYEKISLT